MKPYDVVIIGSGLGGLECGYILSKKGYNVCILEKNPLPGGCLQTFRRGTETFDTGFHFVGGLNKGQFLHTLFKYFDLLDLPWHRLDEEAFAEVVIDGQPFFLPSGHERFVETLSQSFPHQRKQLENYTVFLKKVGEGNENMPLLEQSAYNFLQETITDPLLRQVLSGGSLTMELCAEKLPLYMFAQINNSFIQSAWRLKGGGSLIADKLADSIRTMGGTILTKAEVTRLIEEDGSVTHVEYNGSEQVQGKYIISNLHPALTLSLIPESKYIRKIYRNRITRLQNTYGMFTTHLVLKENTIPYQNRNLFIHNNKDLWDCSFHPDNEVDSALVSFRIPENGNYTSNIDILTPMHWEEVEQWEHTTVGKRGEDYKAFKTKKAEECIKIASQRISGLKDNIERFYTSTPLTYRDYTGTLQGSAYGIRKDYNSIVQTMLSPQTPLSNLFLTGQNLNLHGVLGVSITSFFTCDKITGTKTNIKQL